MANRHLAHSPCALLGKDATLLFSRDVRVILQVLMIAIVSRERSSVVPVKLLRTIWRVETSPLALAHAHPCTHYLWPPRLLSGARARRFSPSAVWRSLDHTLPEA